MTVLNLKKRNKIKRKNVKRVGVKTQPSFRKRNKKTVKRKLQGSFKLFFWRIFSSFKVSFIFIIAFISFVGFGIYWVIQNKYFQVKNYEIVGIELIEESLIGDSISDTKDKWIFFVNPSSLEQKIFSTSNYVKSVYVEKVLPDKLMIHIEERVPIASWRTVNGAYLIDNEGFILDRSINEEIDLESVLSDVYIESEEEFIEEDQDLSVVEISDESEEITEEEQELSLDEILDEDLLLQIELDQKSRGNEQSLLNLDFDLYNVLPDSYKKYPQVKVLSDDIYEVSSIIDLKVWGGYLNLLELLKKEKGFSSQEILIFSETKVLVSLDNSKKVYFRLDENIEDQINLLSFIYGRLMIESIEFFEIDLRFKRPVIRN